MTNGAATNTTQAETPSFGTANKIDVGLLAFGYAEAGSAESPAVILVHGWPYDVQGSVDVAALLEAASYRRSTRPTSGCPA